MALRQACKIRLAGLVVPIVNDVGEEIDVAACRHAREHVAAHHLATVGDPFPGEEGQGAFHDAGHVQQDAAQMRMGLENGREHDAMAATDVDDAFHAGEVVRICHRGPCGRRQCAHGVVEDARLLRVPRQEGEGAFHAVADLEVVLAGADAIGEALERRPDALTTQEHERAHGVPGIGAQAIAHRRKLESPRAEVPDDVDGCQHSEQAMHPIGLRACRLRDLDECPGALGEQVGNAQLGRGVDGACYLIGQVELHGRHLRRPGRLHMTVGGHCQFSFNGGRPGRPAFSARAPTRRDWAS
jgi:hypothetical protein